MRAIFKIRRDLMQSVQKDLARAHKLAHERVGFVACRAAAIQNGILVLATAYYPVADENYLQNDSVGAVINGSAIRAAMQISLNRGVGMFHIHVHEHFGTPRPSRVDQEDSRRFIPDFFNVTPHMPHGTVILSKDRACGPCWIDRRREAIPFDIIMISGAPIRLMDFRV
jgi:hypothetical protein